MESRGINLEGVVWTSLYSLEIRDLRSRECRAVWWCFSFGGGGVGGVATAWKGSNVTNKIVLTFLKKMANWTVNIKESSECMREKNSSLTVLIFREMQSTEITWVSSLTMPTILLQSWSNVLGWGNSDGFLYTWKFAALAHLEPYAIINSSDKSILTSLPWWFSG